MSDSASITFEVSNVRHVRKGEWLADVALDFDGVPLVMNGFRIFRHSATGLTVEMPAYLERGRWVPAVVLPEEMRKALAVEIIAAVNAAITFR
jgi:stage V sporulation protein G